MLYRRSFSGIAAVTLLSICLSGCQSPSEVMKSWVGHEVNSLIHSWGPPAQVFALPDGSGKIYTWRFNRSHTSPGYAETTVIGNTAKTTFSGAETENWVATRSFWVNNSGVIYSWRWDGY